MAIAFPFSTLSGEGARRADEVFLHPPFLPCAARAGEYPKGEGGVSEFSLLPFDWLRKWGVNQLYFQLSLEQSGHDQH
jgi:hypothetical protein